MSTVLSNWGFCGGGSPPCRALPRIDLDLEEARAERLRRLDAERHRVMSRALERHEMVARLPTGQPGGVDEQRRLAVEIRQQVRPGIAVARVVRDVGGAWIGSTFTGSAYLEARGAWGSGI